MRTPSIDATHDSRTPRSPTAASMMLRALDVDQPTDEQYVVLRARYCEIRGMFAPKSTPVGSSRVCCRFELGRVQCALAHELADRRHLCAAHGAARIDQWAA